MLGYMERDQMEQPTFAGPEYRNKKRKSRRDLFLERLDALIP